MTHWADNYAMVGRIRTMSTQVTESRYKSTVKTKARKTNNQASFGGSLLQNNMEVEAAIEMARHLDETGLYWVWSEFGWFDPNQPNLEKFGWFESPKLAKPEFDQSFVKVYVVCAKFIQSLYKVYHQRGVFLGKPPRW